MADHPDFFRAAEEALSRLANFRTQNPMRVVTGPAVRPPSPSSELLSSSMSPTWFVPQQLPPTPSTPRFEPSHMSIPSTAYAPAYSFPYPSPRANHMPPLEPHSQSPQPREPQAYEPQIYPEPLECMTRKMVYDRVYLVLRDNLTEWWIRNPDALHEVAERLTKAIIWNGTRGMYGPDGLQSLYQISMYTGCEGIHCYMCLAVHSKHGGLSILLKGDFCEKDGMDPTCDEEMLALCKDGFDKGVAKLYAEIVTEGQKKEIQKKRSGKGSEWSGWYGE